MTLAARIARERAQARAAAAADAAVAARCASLLALSAPVAVRPVPNLTATIDGRERPADGIYGGMSGGVHRIAVRAELRGIARIHALAHECVHAAQCERIGRDFRAAYLRADERSGYGPNPCEKMARRYAPRIAAILAAESEADA